ncbi:thioesterase II family protein [Teredinibacter purpureus]|uniref:thioesterase II family protein n=1 Tax=Teredinibacter purpureus TaxID=2731756 RepID=UPI0005F88D3A|nr:alpha/beta fold hydrolase [Teredinibacter purpureus]
MNVFCLPYAGGNAKIIYRSWQHCLPSSIKIVPVELAGHGHRFGEPFHRDVQSVVEDILHTITPDLHHEPYAIYGHSMGTLLAYELARAIAAINAPPPLTLFLSGRRPPHNCPKPRNIHTFSDALLLEEMKRMGGTPTVFFEDQSLIDAFLPVFRNDYKILERYRFKNIIHPTSADIVFIHSDDDPVVVGDDVNEWEKYTTGSFRRENMQGGHFFINEKKHAICHLIQEEITCAVI